MAPAGVNREVRLSVHILASRHTGRSERSPMLVAQQRSHQGGRLQNEFNVLDSARLLQTVSTTYSEERDGSCKTGKT